MDADDVTLLDVLHRQVTLVGSEVRLHLLAVNRYGVSGTLTVAVLVKVARQYLILHPSRDAHQHVGVLSSRLHHANLDVAIPRILRSLFQHNVLAAYLNGGCVGSEEVYVYIVVLHAVQIARYGGYEAAEIAGAAGATEPRLTCGVVVSVEGILAVA